MGSERIEDNGKIAFSCHQMRRGSTSFFIRRWVSCNAPRTGSVVILHGIGGHSGYYDEFARNLAALDIEVISYDRRGHGYSGGRRGYVRDLSTDPDDLHWLLTTLERQPTRPICLLGDSWGALLLLEYSRRYSLGVDAIILSSPPVAVDVRLSWIATSIRALATLVGTAMRGRPALSAPFPLEEASADERFLRWLKTDPITNLTMHPNAATVTACLMFRAAHSAAAITLPTLILLGSRDRIINRNVARQLPRVMTQSDVLLEEFTDAHHTLYLDASTPRVAKAIRSWMSGVTPQL